MGVEMTRRGRKRRPVLEDEFWKLILDGVPRVEACRGIARVRRAVEQHRKMPWATAAFDPLSARLCVGQNRLLADTLVDLI